MPVELQFLGSGDAFGSGGRLQTCLLLRGAAAGSVLIDCGASALIAMRRAGVDPASIEWAVLSHLHGDHFAGLPFLILDGQFRRRTRPLRIAGPPGVAERVRSAMDVLFPGSSTTSRRFEVEFRELAVRTPTRLGPAVITAFAVVHPSGAPAYALRLDYAGKIVAYSGDTEWTEALIDVAAGADLFVCEAYFFDKPVKYHLDFHTLAANRSRLGCCRLVVTHMSEDMLERGPALDIETADDLKVINLGAGVE
jgi:ribonuclease BN (tRNA processing enzyme)